MMRRRPGFTLIEVVVGLAIAAMVLLVAREVAGAIAEANARTTLAVHESDTRALASEVLQRTLAAVTISGDSSPLLGTQTQASVRSQCRAGGGWLESCTTLVAVVREVDTPAVVLRQGWNGDSIVVARASRQASLAYLASAGRGATWSNTWTDVHSLPLAVGVVLDHDTTIVPVGVAR